MLALLLLLSLPALAAEPVDLDGADGVPGLGLPPGSQAEPYAPPVLREPAPRQLETRPLPQDSLPGPVGSGLWLMKRGGRTGTQKPSLRGTGFRTGNIKPSDVSPSSVSPSLGNR